MNQLRWRVVQCISMKVSLFLLFKRPNLFATHPRASAYHPSIDSRYPMVTTM